MTGQITRDHLMMRLKGVDLRLPVRMVAGISMDENQRWFACAVPVVEKASVS